MSRKPFRFAVQAFNSASPGDWRDLVRRTEDSAYSAFHLADHILGPGPAMEAAAHPPQMLAQQRSGEWVNWSGFAALHEVERCPPIMIGGGSKGILSIAAREADIVSLDFNNRSGTLGMDGLVSGLAEQTQKKIGWIREAAGERFDSLEIEIGAYLTVVTDQQAATAEAIAGQFGIPAEALLAGPHNLVGSVDYICEELERRRELYGINYVTVLEDGGNDIARQFAPVVARLAGR